MGEETDRLLIRLVEDVSAIKSTVSNLESQIEKLDDRVVQPFQEWVHTIKSHESQLARIETDLKTVATTLEAEDKSIKEELLLVNHRINKVFWTSGGIFLAITAIGGFVWKLVAFFAK